MEPNRTILLVDDNALNRRLVAAMLNGRPYRLVERESGREGLDYAMAHRDDIDLILLGIGMPDLGGIEVCRAIRRRETGAVRLPIIAYTAHALAEERRSFLEAGFDGLLVKPITRDELSALLERYFGAGGAHR